MLFGRCGFVAGCGFAPDWWAGCVRFWECCWVEIYPPSSVAKSDSFPPRGSLLYAVHT